MCVPAKLALTEGILKVEKNPGETSTNSVFKFQNMYTYIVIYYMNAYINVSLAGQQDRLELEQGSAAVCFSSIGPSFFNL